MATEDIFDIQNCVSVWNSDNAGSWYAVDASQLAVASDNAGTGQTVTDEGEQTQVQGSKLQRAIDEEVRRLTN